MVNKHTFPQDGDYDDAANFAQLVGHDVLSDYVITGISFTPDYSTPSLDTSQGVCTISRPSTTGTQSGEERLEPNYSFQLSAGTIQLTDSATNHVFVEPQFGTTDSPQLTAYTEASNASANALKVGTVDTSNETYTQVNRRPATDELDVLSDLGLPDDTTISLGSNDDVTLEYESGTNSLSVENNSGQDLVDVGTDGNVDIPNGTVDVHDNSVLNASLGSATLETNLSVSAYDLVGTGSFDTASSVDRAEWISAGSGSGALVLRDEANSQDILVGNEGGNIAVPNGSLTIGSGYALTLGADLVATDGETLWNESAGHVPQGRLENDTVTINGGNALSGGSVSLGGDVTIDVVSDSIQTDELDLSVSPTWTSEHTFDAGLTSGGDVEITSGHLSVSGGMVTLGNTPDYLINTHHNGQTWSHGHTSDGNWYLTSESWNERSLLTDTDGNVEIPNGSLDVSGGLTSGGDIDLGGNYLSNTARVRSHFDKLAEIRLWNGSTDFTRDDGSGNRIDVLSVFDGGNVSIPNGDLTINDKIGASSSIRLDHSHGGPWLETSGDDGSAWGAVYDSYNSQRIVEWHEGGNVSIPNGSLDVSDDILAQKRIFFDDGSSYLYTNGSGGDSISIRDRANDQQIAIFSEGGNVDIPNGDLNVNGKIDVENEIVARGGIGRAGNGGPEFPDIRTDWITNQWNGAIYQTENPGSGSSGPFISWGHLVIQPRSTESRGVVLAPTESDGDGGFTPQIGLMARGGGDVEIPNGNLDINGRISTNGENIATSGGRIHLAGGYFHQVDRLNTSGGGGDDFRIRDFANIQDIAVFNEGGNVEIPNGDLDVNGFLTVGKYIYGSRLSNPNHNAAFVTNGGGNEDQPQIRTAGQDGESTIQLRDWYNSQDILHAHEGGNVEIPNGNLDVRGGHIRGGPDWFTADAAGSEVEVWDWYNGASIAKFKEGGNIEIPNGELKVGGQIHQTVPGNSDIDVEYTFDSTDNIFTVARLAGGDVTETVLNLGRDYPSGSTALPFGDVEIPNGSLTVNGSLSTGGADLSSSGNISGVNNISGGAGGDFRLQTNGVQIRLWDSANSMPILEATEGGNVEIPNGDLDVSGGLTSGGSIEVDRSEAFGFALDGTHTHDGNEFGTYSLGWYNDSWYSDAPTAYLSSYGGMRLFTSGEPTLNLDEGNNVEIPNGDLNVYGDYRLNYDGMERTIVGSGGFTSDSGVTLDSGDYALYTRSPGESWGTAPGLVIGKKGNYDFYTEDGTNTFSVNNNGNVEIPNGTLSVNKVIDTAGANDVWIRRDGVDTARFGSTTRFFERVVMQGGNVEIPNGDLDVGGNNINGWESFLSKDFTDNGDHWRIEGVSSGGLRIRSNRDSDSDQTVLLMGLDSNINIPNGSLSIQGETAATQTWVNDNSTAYTDSDAVSAVNSESSLSVDISGDADTVDGNDASAFASSGHDHDSRYYQPDGNDSFVVETRTSDPSSPQTGQMWLRTDQT